MQVAAGLAAQGITTLPTVSEVEAGGAAATSLAALLGQAQIAAAATGTGSGTATGQVIAASHNTHVTT